MHQRHLQSLFHELSAALVLYARQWCDLPDDAVQEAFIDLASCCDEPDCAKAWLYAATRRKAQNIFRSEVRRRNHEQRAVEHRTNDDVSGDWFAKSSHSALPPERVIRGLDALDNDERELVVARIWGELNFQQLAELLDCSVSSAHRRYNAALLKLKRILAETNECSGAIAARDPSTAALPSANVIDGDAL